MKTTPHEPRDLASRTNTTITTIVTLGPGPASVLTSQVIIIIIIHVIIGVSHYQAHWDQT